MSRPSPTRLALPLAALAAAVTAGCERPEVKPAPPPPQVVFVSQPVESEVRDYEDFTGRTDSMHTVELRARVSGYLEKIDFKDGDDVKEGDLLFEIDARPYKSELDRSEALLAQSEAHLKRLDADYRRVNNLFQRGNVSREEFDKVAGDRSEAEASVGIARAQFDLAKLNVSYTRITAPIGGRLSRRLVDPGNLVRADETPLTTIVALDPLYVYFDIDERTLLRLRRLLREGKIKSRSEADIEVQAALADEETFTHKGVINFSENKVDPGTGTLRVRATIANPKPYVLSPGLFMRVRLPVGAPRKSLLVAEKALATEQGQKYVYVVDAKNTVEKRGVKVGRLEGEMRVIESGLALNETVITSGLQRVRPGALVEPKPEKSAARVEATPPAGNPAVAGRTPPHG